VQIVQKHLGKKNPDLHRAVTLVAVGGGRGANIDRRAHSRHLHAYHTTAADGLGFQVELFISTGLQPGGTNRNRNRAASAALAALSHGEKPLKRLSPPGTPATGLKPGAN